MKQNKLNIQQQEKIVNKKIEEEFTLKNATIYGGYNLFSDYLVGNGLDGLLEQQLSGMKAPLGHLILCRLFAERSLMGMRLDLRIFISSSR